jgi:hypothetical protein
LRQEQLSLKSRDVLFLIFLIAVDTREAHPLIENIVALYEGKVKLDFNRNIQLLFLNIIKMFTLILKKKGENVYGVVRKNALQI